MSDDATAEPAVADRLREAWRPAKERLAAVDGRHPTNIRVHRALSWLDAAEQAGLAAGGPGPMTSG